MHTWRPFRITKGKGKVLTPLPSHPLTPTPAMATGSAMHGPTVLQLGVSGGKPVAKPHVGCVRGGLLGRSGLMVSFRATETTVAL